MKQGPLGKFTDLLSLYQALSLVVPMQPDLEIDPDLQVTDQPTALLVKDRHPFKSRPFIILSDDNYI